jgi:hypothetical protein
MLILKRPVNLIFNTENPLDSPIPFNHHWILCPLRHYSDSTDHHFLFNSFQSFKSAPHQIMSSFGSSYYYLVSVIPK